MATDKSFICSAEEHVKTEEVDDCTDDHQKAAAFFSTSEDCASDNGNDKSE